MRLIAMIGGLLLSVSAIAAVTYTPQAWRLYRSGVAQSGGYTSAAACDAALRAMPVNVGQTITFRCQQSVVARGVADPPVDCVVSAWSDWTGGEWLPAQCPAEGQQTRDELRTRTILTPASNGGAACPTLTETRTATQACTSTSPPTNSLIFRDDFNYAVERLGSKQGFIDRGWYVKSEPTTPQPGRALGYLYTRSTAPGCGTSPDGSPFLTMEARPVTGNRQTDFYLGLTGRGGLAGRFPSKLVLEFDICMSRAGDEMSDLIGPHNKLFYFLYGPDDAQYPMNNANVASLITMVDAKFVGNVRVPRPNPGDFTFRNYPQAGLNGERAVVANQVGSGNGAMLTSNVGDAFLGTNRWAKVRMTIDTSGENGSYQVEVDRGNGLELIADYRHGVTPGFTWFTAPLDRLGPLNLRMPTTTTLADFWLNVDNFSIS